MNREPVANIDELLFRCLEGEANSAEYEQAWQWVHQSLQHQSHYSDLRDAYVASHLLPPVDTTKQQQMWQQLEEKMQSKKKHQRAVRVRFLRWSAVSAGVLMAYIFGAYTPFKQAGTKIADNRYTIEAPKGGKSIMTLADGSKVWLNAGSYLYFDESFGKNNRKLTLEGEAYFEVAHHAECTFFVETKGITIAALGTAFNVKAYPEDDLIETTLVEGSVRIETNAHSKTKIDPMILEPHQKVTFYKSSQLVSVHKAGADSQPQEEVAPLQSFSKVELITHAEVEASTSWKERRWIVRSESLGQLAIKIERKYDVTLIFEDADLESYKISATLEEETIEQLLDAIRLTIPMDYKIERDRVYVKINPQLKTQYDNLIENQIKQPD